jgi:hypothetical protein
MPQRKYSRGWSWHRERKRAKKTRTEYILAIACVILLCPAAQLAGVDVVAIIGELPRYAGMIAKIVADAWR